jgi:hypothetical protein
MQACDEPFKRKDRTMTIRFVAVVEGTYKDEAGTGPAKLTLKMPESRGGRKIELWVERSELSSGKYFPGDVVDVAITPK